MGMHVLEEDWSAYGDVARPEMPCGLCAVRESIGQCLLQLVQGCSVSLTKGPHPKAQHVCKLAHSPTYSLGAARTAHAKKPCTNRPVQCPKCPLTVWSYSMAAHLENVHGMTSTAEWLVSESERAAVLAFECHVTGAKAQKRCKPG